MLTGCNCFQIWQRVLCVGMKGLVSAHFLCKLAYSIHSSSPGSPGLCHSAGEGFFSPAWLSALWWDQSFAGHRSLLCWKGSASRPAAGGQSLVCALALVEFGGVTGTS